MAVTINDAGNAVSFVNAQNGDTLVEGEPGRCIYVNAVMIGMVSDEGTNYGLVDGAGNVIVPQIQGVYAGDGSFISPPTVLPYIDTGWGVCAVGESLKVSATNGTTGLVCFTIK